MELPTLIFTFIVGLFFSASISYALICWRSHRIPNGPFTLDDRLNQQRGSADSKRVVVLGDSLTHGTMSHHWLNDLQAEFEGRYLFINAGTNGDLAWNALQKVGQITHCQPDVVAVFIGGNDVLASLSPVWADSFITRKQLPQPPTAAWYRQNLESIIFELQAKTDAQLLLVTLTLFGEELHSLENERMRSYSQIVQETAGKFDLPILNIHQKLRAYLTTRQRDFDGKPNPATNHADYRRLMRWSLIRYHFLFQTWDKVSKAHGYQLQTDGVHLNAQAAGVIQQAFSQWLRENA